MGCSVEFRGAEHSIGYSFVYVGRKKERREDRAPIVKLAHRIMGAEKFQDPGGWRYRTAGHVA